MTVEDPFGSLHVTGSFLTIEPEDKLRSSQASCQSLIFCSNILQWPYSPHAWRFQAQFVLCHWAGVSCRRPNQCYSKPLSAGSQQLMTLTNPWKSSGHPMILKAKENLQVWELHHCWETSLTWWMWPGCVGSFEVLPRPDLIWFGLLLPSADQHV